ncbi:unnamed protein product [Cylicocyclus nassatus]|uniref:Uncharacterized protein n=1 Tax=Cylicocyclus nassatus TaxID=53992 RepID=A0AA36H5X5_CYLNA|nr:unnamed protein product [Cylicocyclus nassatus]
MILFTILLLCAISSVQGTFGGCYSCNQPSYGSYGSYGGSYGSYPSYGGSYGVYGSSYGSGGSYSNQMSYMPSYSSSLPQPFGGSGSYFIWYPHALEYVDRRWQEYYQDKHQYRPSYGNFINYGNTPPQYQPGSTYVKSGGYSHQQDYGNVPQPYQPSNNERPGNYGNQQDYGNNSPPYPPSTSNERPGNYDNQQGPPQDYNRNYGKASELPQNFGNREPDLMTEAGTIPIGSSVDGTAGGGLYLYICSEYYYWWS